MSPLLLVLLAFQADEKAFTSPTSDRPEYGHGLSADEAAAGWIALFDGKTTFGWTDGAIADGILTAGISTSSFGSCELQGEAKSAGKIVIGEQVVHVGEGRFKQTIQLQTPAPLRLTAGSALASLRLKPVNLKPLLNRRDLTGCTVVKHPKLAAEQQTKWSVEEGVLRGVGGPGAVELAGQYADFVLQAEIRTRASLVNGGVFFRAIGGDFMNGYEAQVFNACYEHDPAKPARYSTGAVDDRQLARRLVSRDRQPLVMTIVAVGPHIATWVNGYQTVDWTDDRNDHENPRSGRRVSAGALQLQAHDSETDLEFRSVSIQPFETSE
jgi:hypothetical protein